MSDVLVSQRNGNTPEECVAGVLDTLISVGEEYGGLWPSCLMFENRRMPDTPPGPIVGQRSWDRALGGCNLMHDLPTLGLLYSLADTLGRPDYRRGADAYLRTFVENCTETPTGLFPWGEHAFWNLREKEVGNSCAAAGVRDGSEGFIWHDHLRQAPPWFWQKAATISPEAVQRFANGLDRHWVGNSREEYNRHAIIDQFRRLEPDGRSCDFPRHSGFYVIDLACAYREQPREETRVALMRYSDYWWKRQTEGECFPMESRTPVNETEFFEILSTSQTLSLGVSLLDAAGELKAVDEGLSRILSSRGSACCQKFLNAPHDVKNHVFVSSYDAETRKVRMAYPLYGSVYGVFPAAQAALLCCAAYRHLQDPAFLEWAAAVGRACASCEWEGAEPAGGLVFQGRKSTPQSAPALDAGLALELIADLYELSGEGEWLVEGAKLWNRVKRCYFRAGLVSLASGGRWYEAQQGSGYLLHGAARFGLLLEAGRSISPDYSAR